MNKALLGCGVVLLVLIFFALIFAFMLVGKYNTMVSLSETVDRNWAQVENQLKRRFDLIPNLVETVKGYAKHEKEIFTRIAEERAKLAGAKTVQEKIDASRGLEGALARLLVIIERYPDLKANQTFISLMDELAGTENRIATERMRYNNAVKEFNQFIKRIPQNFIAPMFGFKEKPYFEAPEEEKAAPKVKF